MASPILLGKPFHAIRSFILVSSTYNLFYHKYCKLGVQGKKSKMFYSAMGNNYYNECIENDEESLEDLGNELHVKEMRETKTFMCFLFSQPVIGCPLLINFTKNLHSVLKKVSAITNVRYKSVHYIEVFL